jgi:hypothetical protein
MHIQNKQVKEGKLLRTTPSRKDQRHQPASAKHDLLDDVIVERARLIRPVPFSARIFGHVVLSSQNIHLYSC